MNQLTIEEAIASRDTAMATVEANAGQVFIERASAHILSILKSRGPLSGEDLTDECHMAGITPHDDRAFGSVYKRLAKRGLIEKCGTVLRKHGNMTTGGNVWRLKA